MNTCVLIGRLTADPELRYTQSGVPVATFTLAVDRPKSKDREKETDFISIVAWQKTGELCAQYLAKGRQCAIEGRLQIRSYENRDKQKVKVAEIIANNVQFLDKGDTQAPSASRAAMDAQKPVDRYQDDPFADDGGVDIGDDDLPF